MTEKKLTCPSGPAEPGSVLLGLVVNRGQVAYLTPNAAVTPHLLESLREGGAPAENRLRFACSCIERKCVQWKNGESSAAGHCGLIEHAVKTLKPREPDALPQCGIRPTCRWYEQRGRTACGVCPEIIRRPANECRAASKVR